MGGIKLMAVAQAAIWQWTLAVDIAIIVHVHQT